MAVRWGNEADGRRSAAKGVPSKDYAFDIQLYDEIIPEVRILLSLNLRLASACGLKARGSLRRGFATDGTPQETKKQVSDRAIVLILRKKTAKAEYWPRLTKEKPNRNWVKTDFSKASWPLRVGLVLS